MKNIFFAILIAPFIAFAQVPSMLKDLTPGSVGSNIGGFTQVPNSNDIIFSVFSPSSTAGLWRTDGSAAGTQKIKYVTTTLYYDLPNGKKLFGTNTPGYKLWTTDGTSSGTDSIVSTLTLATYFTKMNGVYYFIGVTPNEGQELWRTDGTIAGTYLVKDIWSGTSNGITNNWSGFCIYNNEIYFMANNGISGEELWKSDGTVGGTTLVKDIAPGSGGSAPKNLAAAANGVYFTANNGTTGFEPWFTNGLAAGTNLIADLNAGANSSNQVINFFVGSSAYFFYGKKIFQTNGTTAGTASLVVMTGGAVGNMQLYNNKIYFVESASGFSYPDTVKLKCIPLTIASPTIINSFLMPSFAHLSQAYPKIYNSKLVIPMFTQIIPSISYLYISDGTIANTKLIPEFCDANYSYQSFFNYNLDSIGTKFYTPITFAGNGAEPGYIDLVADTIKQFIDINPGSSSSCDFQIVPIYALKLYNLNSKNYFIAYSPTYGEEIYQTDFTTAGTSLLLDIYPGISSFANSGSPNSTEYAYGDLKGIVTPNNIYFPANDGVNGMEIWSFVNTPNGIKENEIENSIKIFPNPARDIIAIQNQSEMKIITLTDISGRVLETIVNINSKNYELETTNYKPGVYFITISGNTNTITKKVIVTR